ncbi:MAG: 4Fe-4S binding protein [Chloroflexi bacterium]|nr:4Fe-4S binding protein [Chloroflexota bacterium]
MQPRITRKAFFTTISKRNYPDIGPLRNYLRWPRREPPTQPLARRIGIAKVELGYEEPGALEQGGRCLICTLNPIFDGSLCILCNGCVDVCPTNCLKLIPVPALAGNEPVAALIESHAASGEVKSAMLLDPTACIRCGLCAARCPTEAVQMESFRFTEEVSFVEVA